MAEQNKEQATEIDNASIEEPVSDSDGVNEKEIAYFNRSI